MESALKQENGCRRVYTVTCPWDELRPHYDHVLKEIRSHARVPGFRPGKAPEAMLKTRFRKEIRDELLEHFLPEAARELVKVHDLAPVVEPYAAEIRLEEGEPFRCELAVELAPQVPALDLSALAVECVRRDVAPDEVERVLDGLRERAAVMRPVEGAASEGDFAVVQFRRKGQSKGQEKFFQASSASPHPVERALVGRAAGETLAVHVEPAAEGEAKSPLAPGDYAVAVTRLVHREVPELGDELAKDLGADSLAALREKVASDLRARTEAAMRGEQRDKVVDLLVERHPFAVPPTLVDRQVREELEQFAESLARQGVNLEKADIRWDELAASQRPAAERRVRAYYLVDAVVKSEKIEVSDADLEAALEERARAAGASAAALRARYAKEGALDTLRKSLAHGRALDFLLARASVALVDAPPATPGGPDAPHSHGGGADQPR